MQLRSPDNTVALRLRQLATFLAALFLVVSFLFFLTKTIWPFIGKMTPGFIAYYTASDLLVRGELGPQGYDINWFRGQVQALTEPPIEEVMTYNLPTFALLALPLTPFTPQIARDIWMGLNVLFLLTAMGIMARLFQQTDFTEQKIRPPMATPFWLCFAALAFLFPPALQNFHLGQSYIFLLLLYTLTLWGLVYRQDWLVGITLAAAFVLKANGLPLWLLLLVYGRWRAMAWAMGTTLLLIIGSLPWLGLPIWQAFPQATWEATRRPEVTVTAYQTTYSFLSHLFRFDALWNPNPIAHFPVLISIFSPLITLISTAVTLWLARRGPLRLAFAALLCLSIVVAPVAEEHNFVLLLLPLAILAHTLLAEQSANTAPQKRVDWLIWGVAYLLLMARLPYKSPEFGVGWLALAAYPHLYAGWLIWLVALRQMKRHSDSIVTHRPPDALKAS